MAKMFPRIARIASAFRALARRPVRTVLLLALGSVLLAATWQEGFLQPQRPASFGDSVSVGRFAATLGGPVPTDTTLPDTVVVFGPARLDATGAGTALHVEVPELPVNADKRYLLRVENGAADGSARVTQGVVTLNGSQVLDGGQLNDGISRIERAAAFRGQQSDTVSVALDGSVNSYVTVSVLEVADPTYDLFGPATFTIIQGQPKTHDTVFAAPAEGAPFTLEMVNGDAMGQHRVSGARLDINGVEVLSPSDLSNNVGSLLREITLSASNTFSLHLPGEPNGFVVIRIRATDVTPPLLTITSPEPGLVTRDTSILVAGTVEDQTAVAVMVNDQAAEISGGHWSATVPLSSEGANEVTISALDAAGLRTDSTRTVVRDTHAPTLIVSNPADGLVTKDAVITVAGTAADDNGVLVSLSGVPLTVGSGGTFSGTQELVEGVNFLTVTATDGAGNTVTVAPSVTLDTQLPVLTVTEPADGATTSAESIAVVGTVTDATAVTVTVNGTVVTVDGAGAFTGEAMLTEGVNGITITAIDAAGNMSEVARNVTRTASNLPPDPSVVATANSRSVATTLAASTAFLYTGPDAIQTGVAPGVIEPVRAAVVRGRVLDRSGEPLAGVTISVLDHAEFGQTLSRADGWFDLAVNGGRQLTVNYAKDGFLSAQRQVDIPWQDFSIAAEVVLVPLDPQVTVVDFSDPVEVVRGTTVSDVDGTRQATLLFQQGTVAEMVLPDGTTQPLPSLSLRATEYTVGDGGPEAMPGELPPMSAYTYAAELSVDEALAANATEVRFSEPVPFYLENFLGLPVGLHLPVGLYSRERGAWIPSPDGRVIRVISTADGVAEVDVTGSGVAADATQLAAMGFTLAERQRLATLYSEGQTLWRARIPHFSAIDINLPAGPPPDAGGPDDGDDPPDEPKSDDKAPDDECQQAAASWIGCESQTVGERIPLTGTPFQLVYQSRRVPGRSASRSIDIPVTGTSVPASLKRADVTISVAGRQIKQTFDPLPGQSTNFVWDGLDAYGRLVTGATTATVRVGYVYDAFYQVPPALDASFGLPSDSSLATTVEAREEITLNRETTVAVGTIGSPEFGVGGWSLNVHHFYDPNSRTLYTGDGRRVSADVVRSSIKRIAGTGATGQSGDGGPGLDATLNGPRGVTVGPDGSVYIVDRGNARIRRVAPDGTITTVAGGGTLTTDSVPATQARLFAPVGVALGPDGSMYIADQSSRRVYKVTPDGLLTFFAGNGTSAFAGDGGPAILASFREPFAVAAAPDGSVYIADVTAQRIRRVGPDGIVVTVAGGGTNAPGDGGPATDAVIDEPLGVAIGSDGSIYISSYRGVTNVPRVRRVGLDGVITTIAGGGPMSPADSLQATTVSLSVPIALSVAPDGTVYFSEQERQRVWRVGTDGILSRAVGTDQICLYTLGVITCGDNGPPPQAGVGRVVGTAVDNQGQLVIAELSSNIVRRLASTMPGFSGTGMLIAGTKPNLLYEMDPSGRHLRTLNRYTGAALLSFGYDSVGRLATVTDQSGNVTTIERETNGAVSAILGPYAERTAIGLTGEGYLAQVIDPASHSWTVGYGEGGLVDSVGRPKGYASHYTYGSLGRLTGTLDAEGGTRTPVRTDASDGYSVGLTSGLGIATSYQFDQLPGGATQRVTTLPDGLNVRSTFGSDGTAAVTTANGMSIHYATAPDPVKGMQSPILSGMTVTTPGGRSSSLASSRHAVLANPADPFSLVSQVDSVRLNGRLYTRTYDAATRTYTSRTPEGRETVTIVDAQGRVVEGRAPGLNPVSYQYDSRGRVEQLSSGGRVWQYAYDASGRVASVTDPLNRVATFGYDPVGRLTQSTLPGTRQVGFGYDANGNLTSVTPPGRDAYTFGYNAVDLGIGFTAPVAADGASTSSVAYDVDRRPEQVTLPDGVTIGYAYDAAGRPQSVTYPQGQFAVAYSGTTGNVDSISGPGAKLSYTFDGKLPIGVTWTGTVAGAVTATYNNDFNVTSVAVNGQPVSFQYDNDGLITQAGALALTRHAQHGGVIGTTLGAGTSSFGYDGFGALSSQSMTTGSGMLYSASYTRDDLGRITDVTENVDGATNTVGYNYDSAGRLYQVLRNGVLTATYEYDQNGNRERLVTPSGTVTGSYDAQDRLLQYGSASYGYTKAGERRFRAIGADTTWYTHDALGRLTAVELADGGNVEYIVDPQGRRIGTRVNGVLERGFLYRGQLAPVAELDGTGQVVSRFVYATHINVPDYMVRNGQTYRLVLDHLGSVRLVVNAADGSIAQRLDYDEYGRVAQNTNPGFQPFGFAGGLLDAHTGLVRFGARDYDPESGQWITKDQSGFQGGTNLYSYANDDPVNYVDATGRFPLIALLATAGGVINGLIDAYQVGSQDPCASFGDVFGAFGRGFLTGFAGTGTVLLAGGESVLARVGIGFVGSVLSSVADDGLANGGRLQKPSGDQLVASGLGSVLGGLFSPAAIPVTKLFAPAGPEALGELGSQAATDVIEGAPSLGGASDAALAQRLQECGCE